MTAKPATALGTLVVLDALGMTLSSEPLSQAFKALTDADPERRAVDDPDAGTIPPGFWETAKPVSAATKQQITLRLDPDVLQHFRSTGKGYQSRINSVLRSYVRAQMKTG